MIRQLPSPVLRRPAADVERIAGTRQEAAPTAASGRPKASLWYTGRCSA